MSKKKVLIITQEMEPYSIASQISEIAGQMPAHYQKAGMEVRILMPRFGVINERRHRLHEVVRLSGINIIVDDNDYPLIIKVASLPGVRIQVYFLDNDDFFSRKATFEDENDQPFEDNPSRMIFFCKGVVETVKKFGWPPDIIHCHGWMTSLIPLYIRQAYQTEPLFQNSKIVYSLFNSPYEKDFNSSEFLDIAAINDLADNDMQTYSIDDKVALNNGAIHWADGIILNEADDLEEITKTIQKLDKPFLPYEGAENYLSNSVDFYKSLMASQEEE